MKATQNIRVGAFDCGSNAVRRCVDEVAPDNSTLPISFSRLPLALGRLVNQNGAPPQPIPDHAMTRISAFVGEGLSEMSLQQVPRGAIIAVGTSAIRTAPNRQVLVDYLQREHGLELKIIDGIEEGRLAALGCMYRIEPLRTGAKSALVIEIGGGSLQASLISAGELNVIGSFELGSSKLISRYDGAPLNTPAFKRFVEREFMPVRETVLRAIGSTKIDMVIGLGGVAAEIHHQLGTELPACSAESLAEILALFSCRDDQSRAATLRSPDRTLAVIPATIGFLLLTKAVEAPFFRPAETGLREGLCIELAKKIRAGQASDADHQGA